MAENLLTFRQEVEALLGSKLLSFEDGALPAAHIAPGEVYPVVKALYDDPGLSMRFLTSLCGIHLPAESNGGNEQLGLIYFLHDLVKNRRLRLKTFFPVGAPEVESITPLFAGANWMEREAFDFYGIRFKNHPKLVRIYNIESMTVFPLRKDFPLEDRSRHDKDDRFFGR